MLSASESVSSSKFDREYFCPLSLFRFTGVASALLVANDVTTVSFKECGAFAGDDFGASEIISTSVVLGTVV
jgi:hypothetical protein